MNLFKKYLIAFLVSMVPLIELRGSVIIGAGMGMPWLANLVLSVIGNMLPVPFIGILISVVLYAIGSGLIEVLVSPIVEACPFENKD